MKKPVVLGMAAVFVVMAVLVLVITTSQTSRVQQDGLDNNAIAGAPLQSSYPGPTSVPLPTATPTPLPLASGLMPPPTFPGVLTTTVSASPISDTLTAVQIALDAGSALSVTNVLSPFKSVGLQPSEMFFGSHPNPLAAVTITPAEFQAMLQIFLDNQSDIVVQGYQLFWQDRHVHPSSKAACVWLVLHGFSGPVAYPTAPPSALGIPWPTNVPPDSAAWAFCGSGTGQPFILDDWYYDNYYEIVQHLIDANEHLELPYYALVD